MTLSLPDLKLQTVRLLGTWQSNAVFIVDDTTLLTLAVAGNFDHIYLAQCG